MVPVSTGNSGLNNFQDHNGNSSMENNIIRPNSAAANNVGLNPLPNGMMADPGFPSNGGNLGNGSLGGPILNGPMSSTQMGVNGMGNNSPMISQHQFAAGLQK